MALKIGLPAPQVETPKSESGSTASPLPWKTQFPSNPVNDAIDKAVATGQDPYLAGITAKACDHIWNPQTNKCVRCGEVQPGKVAVQVIAAPKPMGNDQSQKPTLPPTPQVSSAPAGSYTALSAIAELQAGRKGTLMLTKNEGGEGFQVLKVYTIDAAGAKVQLKASGGGKFDTRVTARECMTYSPIWRE